MPVRIYDIAKQLGVESKVVLAKAKELGITGAKVPSSSLDKITAEFVIENMRSKAPPPAEPAPPPPAPEPVLIVSSPEASPAPAEAAAAEAPAAAPPEPASSQPPAEAAAAKTEAAAPESIEAPESSPAEPEPAAGEPSAAAAAEPAAPPQPQPQAPEPPPAPKVGDKIGFIKLPTRPAARTGDRGTATRPGHRGGPRFDVSSGKLEAREMRPGVPAAKSAPAAAAPARGGRAPAAKGEEAFTAPTTGELITLKAPVVVRDLAERLQRKPFQVIADLMELNVFASVNQAIDEATAQKVCAKYGYRFEIEKRNKENAQVVHAPVKVKDVDKDDDPEDLLPRPPVVTIMGHVDHGKTTLLDRIRKTKVVEGEAGGITQHIGAYTISIPHPERPKDLQQITFLDTPGHAAFSSMRARGANVTDIVILVVAANDGVMPQTIEALNHARAAHATILVAVNKIDHPNANAARVRQQLQEKELVCEEWGGSTIFVDVSALTRQGIDKLLEMIVLQAEVLELKANPNRRARGNVIESGLAPGGPTATVLVRKGTLHVGDVILCGPLWGKVRALINEEGARLKEATPSVAVRVLGLNGVPEAGLEFSAVESDKVARELAEQRELELRTAEKERRPKVTLENLFDTLAADSQKILKVVVKADTQGSVEAIVDALKKIESTKVSLEVIHSAVGTITESDVILASASRAIILGFHTRIDNGVTEIAKREGVQIKLYAIIYELVDQVKEAMAGLLDPLLREVVIGSAEVRKLFTLSKGGTVAGCVVASGRIVKGKVRVMRRKGLVFEGITQSLRRFQDEVNEVRAGMECGIRLDGFDDFQTGDSIECYTIEKVPQKL